MNSGRSSVSSTLENAQTTTLDLTHTEITDVLAGLKFLKANTADKKYEEALEKLLETIRAAL